MPAIEDATACQTALIPTLRILLCNVNKIILIQGDFSGTLPTNYPKKSEANVMTCFQTGCQIYPKKGCSLQTSVQTSISPVHNGHENNKIFSQVHEHRDDTLTGAGDQIIPPLVPQIFTYVTNVMILRDFTPNTIREL